MKGAIKIKFYHGGALVPKAWVICTCEDTNECIGIFETYAAISAMSCQSMDQSVTISQQDNAKYNPILASTAGLHRHRAYG